MFVKENPDRKKKKKKEKFLKQALDHRLILKKVNRVIKFNLKAWLKKYIDINTELRKQAKNDFEKDFFKLMNYFVFGTTDKKIS